MIICSEERLGSGMSISLMAFDLLQSIKEGKATKYNCKIGEAVSFTEEDLLKSLEGVE